METPANQIRPSVIDQRISLDLVDYRRRVAELYTLLRDEQSPILERWQTFKRQRDNLFATHPQTALNPKQVAAFQGLDYFEFNPELRWLLPLEPDPDPKEFQIELRDDGLFRYRRVGRIHFRVEGQACALSIYWIMGYGGGLFLPFRDQTNKSESYGGGRYLIDSIKNVNLGQQGDKLVIDFNFAYNPSCAYDNRWDCALAPSENWLQVPIRAGEKKFGLLDNEV